MFKSKRSTHQDFVPIIHHEESPEKRPIWQPPISRKGFFCLTTSPIPNSYGKFEPPPLRRGLVYRVRIDFIITGLGLIKPINLAKMPLEMYEDFLKLSVKQIVIQSILTFLGQIMCGV